MLNVGRLEHEVWSSWSFVGIGLLCCVLCLSPFLYSLVLIEFRTNCCVQGDCVEVMPLCSLQGCPCHLRNKTPFGFHGGPKDTDPSPCLKFEHVVVTTWRERLCVDSFAAPPTLHYGMAVPTPRTKYNRRGWPPAHPRSLPCPLKNRPILEKC